MINYDEMFEKKLRPKKTTKQKFQRTDYTLSDYGIEKLQNILDVYPNETIKELTEFNRSVFLNYFKDNGISLQGREAIKILIDHYNKKSDKLSLEEIVKELTNRGLNFAIGKW